MKTLNLPSRIIRKLKNSVLLNFNIDELTNLKFSKPLDIEKIGTDYGGWYVPTSFLDTDSICYCVGCGEDISFDLGLIERFGCHVYGFDPTPRAIKHVKEKTLNNRKYHFFDVGLWDKEEILKFYAPRTPQHVSHSALNLQKTETYFQARVRRLFEIMKDNSHKRIDLLKIDIEGAEYKVIRSIIEDNLYIKILCLEYDEWNNPIDRNYRNRIRDSVQDLLGANYTMVYSEGNGNYTFLKNS